jgi:hypothetical protein
MAKRGLLDIVLLVVILFSVAGLFMIHNGTILGKSIITSNNNVSVVLLNETFVNLKEITLNEIKQQGSIVNVSYSFDNRDYIGNGISIDIWIADSNKTELTRTRDIFPMDSVGITKREVSLDIKDSESGIYGIYIAPTNEPNNYVSENFVYGKAIITGNTILDNQNYKLAGYWIFILIIIIALFLIVRRSTKDKDYQKF